jgi:S1-C subfamily serine protease
MVRSMTRFLLLSLIGLASVPISRAVPSAGAPGTAALDFADLAEAVTPTTVYIEVKRGKVVAAGLQQLARDYDLPQTPDTGPDMPGRSTGSGVIVDTRGIVITNHHVVNGATAIRVSLADKRRFVAKLIGSDPRTDVAVLQIQHTGAFVAADVGDSDTVRVGQWVMAIGHPFDFQFTVTAGIVSARGRRDIAQDEIQDYIQTDAAVNPGSSGGPLFDLSGNVVGINTAIFSPDKSATQNAGISFAIPINLAWRVATELIETGRVSYAGLGAETLDSPAGPNDPRPGAEVSSVNPGGPAEQAGLRRGDVVIAIDGEPIGSAADLQGLILARGVGARLAIRYERGNQERTTHLVTADEAALRRTDVRIPDNAVKWAGATLLLAEASLLARQGIALPDHPSPGILVLAVAPGSPADTAGIAPGDVLLEVQRKPIENIDGLLGLTRGQNTAMVGFWRGTSMQLAAVGGLTQP